MQEAYTLVYVFIQLSMLSDTMIHDHQIARNDNNFSYCRPDPVS